MELFAQIKQLIAAAKAGRKKEALKIILALLTQAADLLPDDNPDNVIGAAAPIAAKSTDDLVKDLEAFTAVHSTNADAAAGPAKGPLLTLLMPLLLELLKKFLV